MLIMFCDNPAMRYKGRIPDGEIRELPVAVAYEHAVAFRHGMFIETYRGIGHGLSPSRILAVYQGIRRMNELARKFDPQRLP